MLRFDRLDIDDRVRAVRQMSAAAAVATAGRRLVRVRVRLVAGHHRAAAVHLLQLVLTLVELGQEALFVRALLAVNVGGQRAAFALARRHGRVLLLARVVVRVPVAAAAAAVLGRVQQTVGAYRVHQILQRAAVLLVPAAAHHR